MSKKYYKMFNVVDREALAELDRDLNRWWENYATEAQYACQKMTERLMGRIVTFQPLGRPLMRGKIEQITDHFGNLQFVIRILPKRGGEGGYKEIYASEIKTVERKKPTPARSGENE